jgi:DNA-binding GntR family transcriptional regulator
MSGRRMAMDIDIIEKAIKASLEEALKRMRQADEELKKAQQGGRGRGNPKLAEALEEYTRCVAELTYYLKASGQNRDTDA